MHFSGADILDAREKAAFEGHIRSGGGIVAVHSASDTAYEWPWYGRLVGAWFASHPHLLGDEFRSNPRGAVHVLATLDEATYSGGAMGTDHPKACCHEMDGGRTWYTAMGHTKEPYDGPLFRLHLLGGIESAAGVAGSCGG